MKKVLAIRHVEIEDLGIFEKILNDLGYTFKYLDISKDETLKEPLENYTLLFVLGGYMGAYEEEKYKFLSYEFKLIEEALKKDIPILGICLGAQILAKVLGARVYPGHKGKEIGWYEVFKTGEHFYFKDFPDRLIVFQWHGDTFDLPDGAIRIYSSENYLNQAFVYQKTVGLQFHLEVDLEVLKKWIKEYRDELLKENINPTELMHIEKKVISDLEKLSKNLLNRMIEEQ
jgi:GMP synthase-like glutamine amidotransferase